jgi:thioredoxin 1
MPQVRGEDASGQLRRLYSARVGVEMRKVEDEELERIKRRKIEEMMRSISTRPEEEKGSMKTLGKPLDLTDFTFKKFVEENSVAVVDCWAPWCGPCRFVSPIIEELARDYIGKISFGKLNVDQNKKVATQYGIMSIPTLLVYKKGKLVDQIVGAMPRQMLEPRITKHL